MSNNGGVATWSKTASSNGGADNTVNWLEGQAPSSINDSARAMMASAAKWRDDISGALVTSGTSVAYSVASNQNFINITDFASQVIAFTPHVTNGAGPVTMTVDGFANIPLRASPGTELLAGVLIQGTPYVALYNNTDHTLYLQNFYGASPYLIPIGAMTDFIGLNAPNSSFALAYGQAISRTTYSTLFALVGTTYGTGDGSTTFNIPDLRGRVVAGKDDMGGAVASRLTSSYFGGTATNLGAVGGTESHALTTAEMPVHNHGVADPGHNHTFTNGNANHFYIQRTTGSSWGGGASGVIDTSDLNPATTGISINNAGSGNAHAIVQPTIVLSKILRII